MRVTFPTRDEGQEYRVLLRDIASREIVAKLGGNPSGTEIPPDLLGDGRSLDWKAQWLDQDTGKWRDVLPELALVRSSNGPNTALTWDDAGAEAYRVVVRDETADAIVISDGVQETSLSLDWSRLDRTHHLRWRVQAYDSARESWINHTGYRTLLPPQGSTVVNASHTVASDSETRTLLLFTVDTEANLSYMLPPDRARGVAEHIFAYHDGEPFGIELIMDELDRCHFTGTFFLDILLEHQFGAGALDPVIETILSRGHDIQLHLHTAPHLRFAANPALQQLGDALHSYQPDQLRRSLDLAVTTFIDRVGYPPVAYRSGAYHFCDAYFDVLPEFGIKVDSSLYTYKNSHVSDWMRTRTQPFRVGDVLEVPVSWMVHRRENGPVGMQFAPFRRGHGQQSAFTTVPPMPTPPPFGPPQTLVYLAHSYSFLTRGEKHSEAQQKLWHKTLRDADEKSHDSVYVRMDSPWSFGPPDNDRVALLRHSLDELVIGGGVRGISLTELAAEHAHAWDVPAGPVDPLPEWVDRAQRGRLTGTRTYSLPLLEALERRDRYAV